MSAIWGCINLSGGAIPEDTFLAMEQPYHQCIIDRFESISENSVAMGCGVQYFTREAQYEALPIFNTQCAFTADVLLDNREELMLRLGIDEEGGPIPDGTILCEMFARYGEDCLNDLLGAYAFVYYDKKLNRVSLVSDATGNRCLYYRIHKGVLFFSTLIKPIAQAVGHEGVNERWINDFLALDNLGTITEYEESPYEGIHKVPPRQIVTWQDGSFKKRLYWQPDTTLLQLENDGVYAEQLKELLRKSVECMLRADETGIMLSGGLDSTSLACYAAPILRDRGKTLYTYTSVPTEGYVSTHPKNRVVDESEDVLKTKAYLESKGCSLDCQFISLAGVNIWTSRVAEMELMEMPYKSLQNILWSLEGQRMAGRDGVRILLNGGYGNVTISLNNIDNLFHELLREKKFITYLRQIYRFGRVYRISKKAMVSRAFMIAAEYYAPIKNDDTGSSSFGNSYITAASVDKYDTKTRFAITEQKNKEIEKNYDTFRKALVNDHLFYLKGVVNTKNSLLTGVIVREPTMDKRLIEFCIRLPADQYARDGVSRRLVRTYLAPDMPAHVLALGRRGLQGADFLEYIEKNWAEIRNDLQRIYMENQDNPIVDHQRALSDIESIDKSFENVKDFDIFRLGYTAMALEFMKKLSVEKEYTENL